MSTETNILLQELHTGFEAFKQANDARLKALEKNKTDPLATEQVERLNALMDTMGTKLRDRPVASPTRPFFTSSPEDTRSLEKKSLQHYLITGSRKGLKTLETKDFHTNDGESGACLLPQSIHEHISHLVQDICPLMELAHVVALDYGQGTRYQYPRMGEDFEKYWTGAKGKERWEKGLGDGEERGSETPKIDMQSIPLHAINYKPRIAWDLMENTGFDLIQWLETGLSQYIAMLCNEAFIRGDGVKKPKGLLHAAFHSDDPEKYKIQVHKTMKNADFQNNAAYETLLDVITSLDGRYGREATWFFSSEVMKKIRLIKSPGENRYLWSPEHTPGASSSLMGYGVRLCDALPALSKNNISLFFGNFKQGYTIVHRPHMTMIRDEFSAKPDMEFLLRYAYGGAVTDGSALKALKFSA